MMTFQSIDKITRIESQPFTPDRRVNWLTTLQNCFMPQPTVRRAQSFSVLRVLSLARLFISVRSQLFPAQLELASLNCATGFTLNGDKVDNWSGYSVSGAGDVNGDGVEDFVIGAHRATAANGNKGAGKSYVMFGQSGLGPCRPVELTSLNGTLGFTINGNQAYDSSGVSVSSAGDVNGDGVSDLLIGAFLADPVPGRYDTGNSYVVFGKPGLGAGGTMELANLNRTTGLTLRGEVSGDWTGLSVSCAGDVNGDGVADLLIGGRGSNPVTSTTGQTPRIGRSYVVFGKLSLEADGPIELGSLDGTDGFAIHGDNGPDTDGYSVSKTGDVNQDGMTDLIVGTWWATPAPGREEAGRSYVVFGRSNLGAGGLVELRSLNGTNGFILNGDRAGDRSGFSVSGVGDVNGDGIEDLLVGAYLAHPANDRRGAGKSYVVFGRTGIGTGGIVELRSLNGITGFALNGDKVGDYSGISVSTAGDVNGDGMSDLLIGARYADPTSGRADAGKTYVVFGKVGLGAEGTLELRSLNGTNGFIINGDEVGDTSGFSVSNAGDVNGDSVSDLIIGAIGANPAPSRQAAGKSYVVFGRKAAEITTGQIQTLPQFDSTLLLPTPASTSARIDAFTSATLQALNRRSSTSINILTQDRDPSPIESGFGLPFAIAGGVCALVSSVASAVFIFRHRGRCGASSAGASEEAEYTVQDEDVNHRYTNLPAAPKYRGLELYPPGHSHYTPIDEVNRLHDEYESARLVRAQENYDDIPRGARS